MRFRVGKIGVLAGVLLAWGQIPGTGLPGQKRAPAEPISALAFHPGGKLLAVGRLGNVQIYDLATGRVRARLSGPSGPVTGLAFRPDGKLLAAAGGVPGKSGEIRCWDMVTGLLISAWTAHSDSLYALALHPQGSPLCAAGYDHLVSLWETLRYEVRQGKVRVWKTRKIPPDPRMLKDHTDAVYGLAFSPDGSRLASVAGDRTLKMWDGKTGKRLFTLSESTAELYAVAFRPDGTQIAAGGADKTLRIWNVQATGGTLARAAFAHQGAILRVLYAPDGKSIYTSGEDNAVKQWDAATLDERKVYPKQSDWPQALALSPDGKTLAVGCHDGSLRFYSP